MFVTLVSCHFVTLISIKSAPVLSTSGDNFREENGKKLVRAISAESIYRCMLLFLDHILYRRTHFVRDALRELCSLLLGKTFLFFFFFCLFVCLVYYFIILNEKALV